MQSITGGDLFYSRKRSWSAFKLKCFDFHFILVLDTLLNVLGTRLDVI